MPKTGVLLINVGSPDDTSKASVARYLSKFLMDPDIITLPWLFRYLLVNGIIVPLRAASSAIKYKKIWLAEGSPLVVLTQKFAEQLQNLLGTHFHVEVGMRCGRPSLQMAIKKLINSGVTEILVAPLFPQFAAATTSGSFKEVDRLLKSLNCKIPIKQLKPFYKEEEFLSSFVEQIHKQNPDEFDHVLFSFHGLPENQIKNVEGCLKSMNCCEKPTNINCYRHQCIQTAQHLSEKLKLHPSSWSYSFQSRLGRTRWIEPYTETTIKELTKQGKNKVLVVCPSFVTDCLETLEEIGIGLRKDFLQLGGAELSLSQCPNDTHGWVYNFSKILLRLKDS